MNKPKRIQRKRTKGWRMPSNAVYVGRPTKYGNPFKVKQRNGGWQIQNTKFIIDGEGVYYSTIYTCKDQAIRKSIQFFKKDAKFRGFSELRGKDLACWCPLGQPCHADVLLELANGD